LEDFYKIEGVKSDLLTRRYPLNSIETNWFDTAKEALNSLFRIVDQFTARSIIAGKYYEGIEKGLSPEEAMKIADDYTARIIADRSWGQLPNLMGSKTLGIITQFQTEINNMFSNIIKDIPKQYKGNAMKVINALITFSILSYLYNEASEKVTGRRPTIDPIYAVLTLMGVSPLGKNKAIGKKIWNTIVDMGGNLPFGNIFVQGGRFPISAGLPDWNKVLNNPELRINELMKPLYYFALPIAGGQAKKTIEGTSAFMKGGSFTPKGRMRYRIEQDFSNFLRGFLFGKNSFPEAIEYRNKYGTKNTRGSIGG
jgi:hypothetical protein